MFYWKAEAGKEKKIGSVFNAYSEQRFFESDIFPLASMPPHVSLDKLSVIDEIISANIAELTHRTREE